MSKDNPLMRGSEDDKRHRSPQIIEESGTLLEDICKKLNSDNIINDTQCAEIVNCLKEYTQTSTRVFYSVIYEYVANLQNSNERERFHENAKQLIAYIDHTKNNDVREVAMKVYDHIKLSIAQFNTIEETTGFQSSLLMRTIDSTRAAIQKNVEDTQKHSEEIQKNLRDVQTRYVTILGIFASIVLSFVSGLKFTETILYHVSASLNVFAIIAIASLIGLILSDLLAILMIFLLYLNQSTHKLTKNIFFRVVIGFNVLLIVGIVISTIAWWNWH